MVDLPTLEEIEAAAARLQGHVLRTPLVRYGGPSGDRRIYLKLENLQPHGSFKLRAATNALLGLSAAERSRGVYTGSAGNFALGLAAAARRTGTPLKVFAPKTAAKKKIDALAELGAAVELIPFDEWWTLLENHGAADVEGRFIHPVADRDVIAGNATIGREIMADLPQTDVVLVPFGGGGLSTGIALAGRAKKADLEIFGCESEAATPLGAAFAANEPVDVPFDDSTFINGIGSTSVLDAMWPHLRRYLAGARVVSIAQAKAALRALARHNAVIAEGAGAVSLAAALAGDTLRGKTIVCVISGGNIDMSAFAELLADRDSPF